VPQLQLDLIKIILEYDRVKSTNDTGKFYLLHQSKYQPENDRYLKNTKEQEFLVKGKYMKRHKFVKN